MNANKIYWKIFGLIIGLLMTLGILYVLISSYTTQGYFMESNQKLNGGIAAHMITEISPFVNGEVDTAAVQDIMHSMMVINPSVEVYLLNPKGEIITYVAPYKKVVLKKVGLEPVKKFIADGDERKGCYLGDDPRSVDKQKVFSAASIKEGNKLSGYIYIILASEERSSVMAGLSGNYFLKLGTGLFALSILTALILGGIILWFLMKNLRIIMDAVQGFKNGDFQSRVPLNEVGDLREFGQNFNEMADNIVANFDNVKKLEKLRRELIANVSHDLRTPLSVIQGYAETMLLKDSELTVEDQKKYVEIIYGNSQNLTRLVNQLFELSKLEAEQKLPQKEAFSLADLANDLILKYKLKAEDKGIEFVLNIDDSLPLVFADISMVERVFQNLIDNALKFTPQNGVITLELKEVNNQISCKLTDTGMGIKPEDQEMIFDRFKRSSTKMSAQKREGTGLGLAIVKKILELHETSIKVQSRLNEGTSFIFSLPVSA